MDKSKLNVSVTFMNDKIEVRYGGFVHTYQLDADAGDVGRFVGGMVKMNVEKYQRHLRELKEV